MEKAASNTQKTSTQRQNTSANSSGKSRGGRRGGQRRNSQRNSQRSRRRGGRSHSRSSSRSYQARQVDANKEQASTSIFTRILRVCSFGLLPREDTQSSNYPDPRRLFIGNLSYDVDEDQIKDLLTDFGNIVEVDLAVDKLSKRSLGFAFVRMSSAKIAQRVIAKLHNKEFSGRRLRVNIAKNPSRA